MVLARNRDAALALEVVRVHDTFDDVLIGSKDAALFQHGVNQRSLAVVNVSDEIAMLRIESLLFFIYSK